MAAALSGAVVVTQLGLAFVAAGAAITVVALLLRRYGIGCGIGLLILAALDALPGPNLETLHLVATITGQDLVVAVLIGVLVHANGTDGFRALRQGKGRLLCLWTCAFLLYWGATVVRTWLTSPVPLLHAVWWSRDFSYLAILLPLLFGALDRTDVRTPAILTLAAGAVVAGFAQAAVVAGHVTLSALVHTERVSATGGLTRLYTSASDLPFAGLPFGAGLALFGDSRRRTLLGAAVALVSLVAIALGLTRSMYLGIVVGLTVAGIAWILRADARARQGRRQIIKALLAGGLTVALIVFVVPATATNSAVNGVSQRVTSLTTFLGTGSAIDASTRARASELSDLRYVLGGRWLFGLGFLDPRYSFVAGVPGGSIRNSDVGVLSAVETMGVVGTVIYVVPLLAMIALLMRQRFIGDRRRQLDWLGFGALAWGVATVVSSATLGLLFSPAQVVGSATVLALGVVVLAAHEGDESSKKIAHLHVD